MLQYMESIMGFFMFVLQSFWNVMNQAEVLAGFLALAICDRVFNIFDVLRR